MSEHFHADDVYILNEHNVLITKEFINTVFKKYNINHSVVNINLYQEAMTHSSYCKIPTKRHEISNTQIRRTPSTNIVSLQKSPYERLEFLGDSIIHAILAEYIFKRYDDQQEGFMTKLRTRIENGKELARFSRTMGLDKYVLISRYYEELNARVENTPILEDIFEAFIGALFLDHKDDNTNFDKCRALVIRLTEELIDFATLLHVETNYKDRLLIYAHEKKMPDPTYNVKSVIPDGINNKIYVMIAQIGKDIVGIGEGKSKKKGEQEAAAAALRKFGVIDCDSDDSEEEYEMFD